MLKNFITLYFKLNGWKFVDNIPEDLKSFVMLGAPHTSNFDFIPAMAISQLMKRNGKFIIKNEWLRFPMNLILAPMGAIGIDRKKIKEKKTANSTDLIAKLFKEHEELVLMISPEATRSPNPHWKSGFYYIAKKAGVPIVLGYADWAKKEAGLGLVIYPTEFEKDMKLITEFYKNVNAKHPENFKLNEKY
jgi:1-acyl-sn-glycerol-3-phosphate acyltransferase